ncbi:hypothetical protein WH47_00965 [Habropoda laboriosa]|uniref:Glycoprotein n=1 Tax=Habropoda laboriosa TaxID=597456 RepID=A0A0L7QK01_9HYME|nr:hypothetical protein WH47_00965 [Habropoda laboriosa]
MFALIILVLTFNPLCKALIAYDCAGRSLNIATFSLTNIGNCEIPSSQPHTENQFIQLLQRTEYTNTRTIQCKIKMDRIIYYCGMHSHISAVQGGQREYLMDVTNELCNQLHKTGQVQFSATDMITGLKANSTTTRSLALAGTLTLDGQCTGAQYSDPFGTWNNVVVQASITITLRSFYAPIRIKTSQVILPSGRHCLVTEEYCEDTEGEATFWTTTSEDNCHFNRYDVLYEGTATKIVPPNSTIGTTIYSLTSDDITFALTTTSSQTLCGYVLLKTEHPKLFILATSKGNTFKSKEKIEVNNLDLLTYVNSKFVYVERHIKTQITELYTNIVHQKCVLEQQVLRNALALANVQPEELALAIMKQPGYMAVTAGEVVHLIKCIPVETIIRHTESCYKEPPVTVRNASLFIKPKSRILTRTAMPKECNELLPTMFEIHGNWYKLGPKPTETLTPPTIRPLTTPTWNYKNPTNLATSGIYSQQQIDELRDHILFPIEKPATLNIMAHGAMGGVIPQGTIHLDNLLDEAAIKRITESTARKIWDLFTTFGSISAGCMGIYLTCRIIKLILDTLINGYALHAVYGWSVHLLSAMWDSLAQFLIFRGTSGTPPQHVGNQPPNESTPMTDEPTRSAISPESTPQQPTHRQLYPSFNKDLYMAEIPLRKGEVYVPVNLKKQFSLPIKLFSAGGRCDVVRRRWS